MYNIRNSYIKIIFKNQKMKINPKIFIKYPMKNRENIIELKLIQMLIKIYIMKIKISKI